MGTRKGCQRLVISLEFWSIALKSCLPDENRLIPRLLQQNRATGNSGDFTNCQSICSSRGDSRAMVSIGSFADECTSSGSHRVRFVLLQELFFRWLPTMTSTCHFS